MLIDFDSNAVTGKFKNDILNKEPFIGFSDDDVKNAETITKRLERDYEKSPVNVYLTKGGEKKKVN